LDPGAAAYFPIRRFVAPSSSEGRESAVRHRHTALEISLALSALLQLSAPCPVTAFTLFLQFPAFQAERNFTS